MFSHLFRVTHMSLKLGVVMDPIESINYKKDTTLALLWAAQDRGWSLFYIEPDGLSRCELLGLLFGFLPERVSARLRSEHQASDKANAKRVEEKQERLKREAAKRAEAEGANETSRL